MSHSENTILYSRSGNYLPRVAAVHDICGYGNCSLAVAMPVLSCAGVDVCPVPTAVFSSHTKYKDFTFIDTTDHLTEYLDCWGKIGVELDGIYSGFLGSAEQVDLIHRLYKEYPQALKLVDPVMGDAGVIYATYTPELCQAMCSLANGADILTPNLTEAAILTGLDYKGQDISDADLHLLCSALQKLGAKYTILKGVVREDMIYNYLITQDEEPVAFGQGLLPYNLHGTGDLFCSSLIAAIYAGKSLAFAIDFAGKMVCESMITTCEQPDFAMRGVNYENKLGMVCELLNK